MPDTGLHPLFGKAINSNGADYKEPVYKLVVLTVSLMILPSMSTMQTDRKGV